MAERSRDVEIRTRFDGKWVGGYEVVETTEPTRPGQRPRVRVRRRADGRVLPATFTPDEVRPDR